MSMQCPICGKNTPLGRYCEKCGAELPDVLPASQSSQPPVIDESARTMRIERPLSVGESSSVSRCATYVAAVSGKVDPCGDPVLEMDKLCVLFEKLVCSVRFRFDPRRPGEGLQNLAFTFTNQLTGEKVHSQTMRHLDRAREFAVTFPAQEAGTYGWCLTVEYECDGRRRTKEGDVQLLVIRPQEAQTIAKQLSFTINNNVSAEHGSSVHLSNLQKTADDLANIASAENPFVELRRIVSGSSRAWSEVALFDVGGMMPLPPMPDGAKTERVTLDLCSSRISFFAGRTVTFGRHTEMNDISLRPPANAGEADFAPYRMVSRVHCHFEHQGDVVHVVDGRRDEFRVLRPSSGGTFWNGEKLSGPLALAAGQKGVLSFGGSTAYGAISLEAEACSPAQACTSCPHANRRWCGEGRRPSLMLARCDGVPERFVALWSCFMLDWADPSFSGVVIFRKNGGFAWRRGRRCGWLVPGASIETDFGTISVIS